MLHKISANSIIDSLMPCVDDIHERYRRIPRGVTIWEDSPYRPIYERARKAEQQMILASDLLNIQLDAIYNIVLIARRWYLRTDWQRCLPESDAERLIICMIKQSAKK